MTDDHADESRRHGRRSWAAFGATTGLLVILETLLCLAPKLKKFADEHGLQLPSITKTILSDYVPAFGVVFVLWFVLLLKEFSHLSRLATLRINYSCVAVVGVLTGITIIGVFAPLINFQRYM